jgi:hypothetical protein
LTQLHDGKQIVVQFRVGSSHLLDDRVNQQNETVPLIDINEQLAHARFVVVLEGMVSESHHKPVILMR